MLPIAGQTTGPIGLTFFGDTHGGCYRLKRIDFVNIFFLKIKKKKCSFYHGQRRALHLVSHKTTGIFP